MPTYKRIDGDYNITTINPADNVVVNTHTLQVNGNLDVAGNLTYINVTELNIRDPFILLNSSNTGSYASNSGVLVHETATNFAGIRYNANSNEWELSVNTDTTGLTGTWNAISTGATPAGAAGANTDVQFNDGGMLAGNAAFTFDKTTGQVAIDGSLALSIQIGIPSPIANSSIIYANTASSGGTGVYYVSGATNQDELISATRAKLYSIIF
jgi:hypothetical protein